MYDGSTPIWMTCTVLIATESLHECGWGEGGPRGCSEKAYVIRRSYRPGHTKHEAVAEATIEYVSMNVVLYLASKPLPPTAQYSRGQQCNARQELSIHVAQHVVSQKVERPTQEVKLSRCANWVNC